ncbi:uncharacterized protein SCHCODRAFT_02618167 [Schizophyllum commune H4-8]|uniref:uncharacterized protein n=1 Tax=Schizophyllum commune (strain H4-8 / FGSC 9210) TaxID=578458 RepID=UPI00215F1142|nr:uncharacterized protein SCHCODRAFT_02618167 [Schizophyllum commune H4-8]KAI5894946.1 hypothetical protein SCHCODRAFT_02618167 [Schizophyllum commune H4-8]
MAAPHRLAGFPPHSRRSAAQGRSGQVFLGAYWCRHSTVAAARAQPPSSRLFETNCDAKPHISLFSCHRRRCRQFLSGPRRASHGAWSCKNAPSSQSDPFRSKTSTLVAQIRR